MKTNAYSKLSSGRSGGRHRSRGNQGQNIARQRNHAKQQLDKYLALARDARMSGDRTAAEGYFQHAEHFQRLYSELAPTPSEADTGNSEEENTLPDTTQNENGEKALDKGKIVEEGGAEKSEKKTPKKPKAKEKPSKPTKQQKPRMTEENEGEASSVVEIDIEVTP